MVAWCQHSRPAARPTCSILGSCDPGAQPCTRSCSPAHLPSGHGPGPLSYHTHPPYFSLAHGPGLYHCGVLHTLPFHTPGVTLTLGLSHPQGNRPRALGLARSPSAVSLSHTESPSHQGLSRTVRVTSLTGFLAHSLTGPPSGSGGLSRSHT